MCTLAALSPRCAQGAWLPCLHVVHKAPGCLVSTLCTRRLAALSPRCEGTRRAPGLPLQVALAVVAVQAAAGVQDDDAVTAAIRVAVTKPVAGWTAAQCVFHACAFTP